MNGKEKLKKDVNKWSYALVTVQLFYKDRLVETRPIIKVLPGENIIFEGVTL